MEHRKYRWTIVVLGALAALGPLSTDMYLPAFGAIAHQMSTSITSVSMSLSSFFIGVALGQLFYGPLLDYYGRRRPLYIGLVIYIVASIGCTLSNSLQALVTFRFFQALGACAASVASITLARDLFSAKELAKALSSVVLVTAVSPLIAPGLGGLLSSIYGWPSVFVMLAGIASMVLTLTYLFIPDINSSARSNSLKLDTIVKNYIKVFKEPYFYTFAFTGGAIYAGLFAYLASSPFIFMEMFMLSAEQYGLVFSLLVGAYILASQVNRYLLNFFDSYSVLRSAILGQLMVGILLLICASLDLLVMGNTICLFFIYLATIGFILPNTSALTLKPFSKRTGMASALLGTIQLTLGGVSSYLINLVTTGVATTPAAVIMMVSSFCALVIAYSGRKVILNHKLDVVGM